LKLRMHVGEFLRISGHKNQHFDAPGFALLYLKPIVCGFMGGLSPLAPDKLRP
jgi:hypothetical protein